MCSIYVSYILVYARRHAAPLYRPLRPTPVYRALALALLATFALPASAQTLWTDVSAARLASPSDLEEYRVVRLDLDALRAVLEPSPAGRRSATLPLPLPEGGTVEVVATESSVMPAGLQSRFPSIRTFSVQGGGVQGRFSVTPHGFRGVYLAGARTVAIDAAAVPGTRDAVEYLVYDTRDVIVPEGLFRSLGDDALEHDDDLGQARTSRRPTGEILRTYRLAVSSQAELTRSRGGTVELGLAEVVAFVNRANVIFERDLTTRLELIENNDEIIYTDPETDPFGDASTTPSVTLLNQNHQSLNATIGADNYDIGHVFTLTGFGTSAGQASLNSVCVSTQKGRAYSSLRDGSRAFDLLVFPHEAGHQFGAPHSFVEAGQNFSPTGVEPGPGYTIMSYADFATYRPPAPLLGTHFHGDSIDEMEEHVTRTSCGTETETGNDIPVVTVPEPFTIPLGAAFTLEGSATDDSGTQLLYNWEQMDRFGDGQGAIPFFRSLDPVPDPERSFPSFERLYGDFPENDVDERFPDRAAVYTFQLTVRDNVAGGGAVGEAQVQIDIVDGGEPFEITSLSRFVVFEPGETTFLTWNVSGTDGGDIDADQVDILLSVDNGETFVTIAEGVPNDGSHEITMPTATTETGRIIVRPVGTRFFATNVVPFGIGAAPAAALSATALDFALDPGETETRTVTISNTAGSATTLDYDVELRNITLPGGGFVGDEDFLVSTSADDGGPSAGFEDITDGFKLSFQPTLAQAPAADDGVARLTIPFQFPFYGRSYRTVFVSTNGLLILGNEQPHDATNNPIPSAVAPNGVIAPFWDDLTLVTSGSNPMPVNPDAAVFAAVLDDGRFAVQWNDVARFDEQDASLTFQAILDPDGSIEFQYGDLDGGLLDRATVGVENIDGTSGVELAYDEDFVTPNSAVRLETPVQWLSLRGVGGDVAGGGSDEFEVTVDASELAAGTRLTADVFVRTSDASNAVVVIPVTLQLSGSVSVEDALEGVAVSLAAPNPTSSRAVVRVDLAAPGAITATVHDALGRQVALVYDGDASGSLDLEVDAAGLAAGVYLVRVAGEGFVTTRQLVVAR